MATIQRRAIDALKKVTPVGARRKLVRIRLAIRRLTAAFRVTPDFIILGGQRCGTSSLYKNLGQHPEIAPSLRKEVEYFTIDYNRGASWYRAHFPLRLRRTVAGLRGHKLLTFEATPDYIFDPRAPQRVKRDLPEAKLIVLLREPVSRAYSHFHHMSRLGLEKLPFADAVEAEEGRLDGELEEMQRDPYARVLPFRRHSYAARGLYAEQLERWFGVFPREQILILMFDDLIADPVATLHRIADFVGVAQWAPAEFRNYSYTARPANNPDIPEKTARLLEDYFAEPNRQLDELIGTDLGWGK